MPLCEPQLMGIPVLTSTCLEHLLLVLKAPTVGTVGLYFIFFLLTTYYLTTHYLTTH